MRKNTRLDRKFHFSGNKYYFVLTMTLTRFNLLPEDEQNNVLWTLGVFLDERPEAHYRVLLYRLHGFYVEVYYEHHRPIKFVSFSSIKLLEPYVVKRADPVVSGFQNTGHAWSAQG